jgi:HPt (histidine-containing phosphotransfer) domain-containing protein
MGSQALFEERFVGLRDAFVGALPGRLEGMRAALAQQDREALRQEAHRLAGTGVSYGVPELTVWGRSVEQLCRQGATAGELGHALDELAALIARIAPASVLG